MKSIILTGDRPTGPLHLGHFVGSLKNRVRFQEEYLQYVLIADLQALTDNFERTKTIRDNVFEVALDYLAVGLDPKLTTFAVQSQVPELAELTSYFLNFVTVARLGRNPTVKQEIKQKKFEDSLPAGFLCYPVSQAADILGFDADLVPVGDDQNPMIEQTNEIARRFNSIFGGTHLKEVRSVIGSIGRLPGVDGSAKMGKSLGNAIFLSDSVDQIRRKVNAMYTDPKHINVADPGEVEGHVVFMFLDFLDPDKAELEQLKAKYRRGGLGDGDLKKRLVEILEALIGPIRVKRQEYQNERTYVKEMLQVGTAKAREVVAQKVQTLKTVMGMIY